jgi:hypothetical protein
MKFKLILAAIAVVGAMQVGIAYANHEMGHGEMFKEADTNKDGKVSMDEFKAQHEARMNEMFKKMDANGDGFIDETERKAGHEKMEKNCKMGHKKMDGMHKKMDDARPAAK